MKFTYILALFLLQSCEFRYTAGVTTMQTTASSSTDDTNSTLSIKTETESASSVSDTTASYTTTSPTTTDDDDTTTQVITASLTTGNTTEQKEEDYKFIIIVAVAGAGGTVVGVVATIIVMALCRRKKVRSSGSKRLSIKRNVSYTVNKLSTKSSQAELPAYIQILPDPAAESDDFSDIKPKQETSGNEDNKANTVDIKREEDEYDIVEDELKNDIVYHETQNDKLLIQGEAYSNIKIDGRKLSDVNYSDTNLQQTSSVCRENDFDITKTNGLKETDRNYFTDDKSTDLHNANDKNDDYYSNLNENINIALQTMDRTIADFENDTSACNPETTVYSENDSEYDIEETYNHLGSLKCKNDYVSSKLNLGQRQRHRSRSLPAEDLKPQVKIICDNIDMYDHLNKTKLVREPTYYNWQPVRHIRTKSLNSQENTKGIKKGDVDAYSHINLKDNNRKSRIKNDSATDVSSSDMLLNNHSPCSELQKQAAFTIRENDSDTQLHSYFILEPNP